MLFAAAWAHRNRTVLALTIDGWKETMPDTFYHRRARPWLLRGCSAVVCCSEKGKSYFRSQGIREEQLFQVPLVPAWDPPHDVTNYQARPFSLLWCARINDDAKNAVYFENVAIAIHQVRSGTKVRVVGSGVAEKRMLARLSAAGVDVTHDSYIPWHAISDVYLKSRLLLLPSLLEPWGLVCNEAMQCGVPCIVSTHVGAGGELVRHGKTGYVCDLDLALWVDTVRSLLDDRDRWATVSDEARREASKNSVARSADCFVAAVDSLSQASLRKEKLQ
jgi:glycosyltransferase involved in cell wall biosynthesis